MKKFPCVYIVTNKPRGTLYIGVTSHLIARIWEHKTGASESFTARYRLERLVWYELHEEMESAIQRETALKRWNRLWKIQLIEKSNPEWKDLYSSIVW